MKYFNSVNDLVKHVNRELPINIEIIGKDIKSVLRFHLNEWLNGYSPKYYERTDMLINSITVSKVKSTGNGYEIEIYFDANKITPASRE
jgi:hypothetical protein